MSRMAEDYHPENDREQPPKKRNVVRLNPGWIIKDVRFIDDLYTNIRTNITYVSDTEALED